MNYPPKFREVLEAVEEEVQAVKSHEELAELIKDYINSFKWEVKDAGDNEDWLADIVKQYDWYHCIIEGSEYATIEDLRTFSEAIVDTVGWEFIDEHN